MVQQRMCVPVFFYAYRPYLNKQFPEDSGFSVTMFENGVMVYSRFINQNVCAEKQVFSLDPGIYNEYMCILDSCTNWLQSAPDYLRNTEQGVFASCFAYDGVEPIHIWNINRMICEPFASFNGLWARRLYLLFEEVASLFIRYGISLSLDNFYWNPSLIQPVTRPDYGMNTSVAT